MYHLLDTQELASYLSFKKETIYNWLRVNTITGIKVGGAWRFDKKKVDDWLESRRKPIK